MCILYLQVSNVKQSLAKILNTTNQNSPNKLSHYNKFNNTVWQRTEDENRLLATANYRSAIWMTRNKILCNAKNKYFKSNTKSNWEPYKKKKGKKKVLILIKTVSTKTETRSTLE